MRFGLLLLLLSAVQFLTAQPLFYQNDSSFFQTAGFRFSDIYRESSALSTLNFYEQHAALRYQSGSDKILFRITLANGGVSLRTLQSNDIHSVRFDNLQNKITAGVQFRLAGFTIQPQFSVHELHTQYRFSYSLTAGIAPTKNRNSSFSIKLYTNNEPFLLQADVTDQSVSLPMVYAESGSMFNAVLPLNNGFFLEGVYREGYPEKSANDNGYRSIAGAATTFYSISLHKEFKYGTLNAAYSDFSAEGSLESFLTATNFSYIAFPFLNFKSYSLNGKYLSNKHHLSADITYYTAQGKLAGNVQTWPFSSLLISTFGNRINFIVQGKADLFSFCVQDEIDLANVKLIPEIRFFDLRPSMTTETWQPQFLIFGVRDYRKFEMSITRTGIALLSLAFQWDVSMYRLSCSGGQLLPVYITRRVVPPSDPQPPATSTPKKSDGGRWLSLSFGIKI